MSPSTKKKAAESTEGGLSTNVASRSVCRSLRQRVRIPAGSSRGACWWLVCLCDGGQRSINMFPLLAIQTILCGALHVIQMPTAPTRPPRGVDPVLRQDDPLRRSYDQPDNKSFCMKQLTKGNINIWTCFRQVTEQCKLPTKGTREALWRITTENWRHAGCL